MNDIYLNNPNLKSSGVSIEWTEDQAKEYVKCMEDPIYFIKSYVQIVNLDKGLVPFDLYPFQEKTLKGIVDNDYNIILKSFSEIEDSDYIKKISDLILNKSKAIKEEDIFKRKSKIARFLYQKGFETELIWQQIEKNLKND